MGYRASKLRLFAVTAEHGRTKAMVAARTRFVVPNIPNASIVRAALLARLTDAAHCPLTVVAGAPGSGKSALLAQWAGTLQGPMAWLSCDVADGDPALFWRDLSVAIRQAWTAERFGDAGLIDDPPPAQMAIDMADALAQAGKAGVIVIDDFHLAAPEPATMVAFIEALPPSVRLVLGSHHDPTFPLSRMRVQGRLLELRQVDLRFTSTEIRSVLGGLGVRLSQVDLDRLEALTEGWAAGVYLAGLSLQATPDPPGMLRRLLNSEHSLVDFLISEVIDLQPPDLREFLMVTGQLEPFDAALCDLVTGRSDSALMLERVRAGNLFLVELDREGAWYRYHHLFGEFLRARLRAEAPARVPLIHRMAAEAYVQRGDLLSAVRHSMSAGDAQTALARLATHMATATSSGDEMMVAAVARTWLAEHGAEHLDRVPQRILECVIALDATGSGDTAALWLQRIEDREAHLDPANRFLLHAAWGFHLLYQGDPAQALARGRLAESVLRDQPVDNIWVPSLAMVLVQAQLWLDDLDGAVITIDSLRANATQSAVLTEVRMPGYGAQAEIVRGDIVEAERLAIKAVAAADQLGLPAAAFGRAEPVLAQAEVH